MVLYTASAENDLLEAWLYIAEDNAITADRVVESIQHEALGLLEQPLMGRQRNDLHAGLHSWPTSTPYVLYYFPADHGITVARVLHHARDTQSIEYGLRALLGG